MVVVIPGDNMDNPRHPPNNNNGDIIRIPVKKLRNVEFEDAMEHTGCGKYNTYLTLTCGLCFFVVCNEAYSLGYILPMIACDLQLDTSTKGLLTSVNFMGLAGSGLFWGYIADKKGRRNLLITCMLMSFGSSLIGPFMTSFWAFSVARFFNGISVSGPAAVLYAYVGEFHTPRSRPKAMALFSLFMGVAFVFLPGLSWLTILTQIDVEILSLRITPWRLYLFINSLLNLLVAVALMKFPESPTFLYYSRNASEALKVLRRIYAVNSGEPEETFPVESLDEKLFMVDDRPKEASMVKELWNQITPFFKLPHLTYISVGCYIQAVLFAVSSGLFIWYPDIINKISSASGNVSLTVCQALQMPRMEDSNVTDMSCTVEDSTFIQSIIIGILYIAGYVSWGFLVKMLGNRTFFLICMVLSSIATVMICFVTQEFLVSVGFMVTLVMPGIATSVVNTMMVDLFPTFMCGMSICLVLTAGRIGSVISSTVVGMMLEWNCLTAILLYAVALAASLILSLLFPRRPAIYEK